MTISDCKDIMVISNISLIEAVKLMNSSAKQILLVVDDQGTLVGVVTDGDIRRALLENIDFSSSVNSIMNTKPITLCDPPNKKKALSLMKKHDIRQIPIVSKEGKATGLLLWKDFYQNGDILLDEKDNQVVIMAGGKGTRLDLFTKILPKPLIPIGEKPIIEHIMDHFYTYGFKNFTLTLNYKAEMIKMYFSDNGHKYRISYIQEEDFLGTAGSLSLFKGKLDKTFIVSNCDVIVDANVNRLFQYHNDSHNQATILGSVQNIKIPYGVLKSHKADLEQIVEKPEYHFVINSGVYVLEPELIDLIPEKQSLDMPDLLMKAKACGMKVQTFPMTCTWFDVGQWGEYKRAVDHMNGLGVATQ